MASELDFDGVRHPVDGAEAVKVMTDILTGLGCGGRVANAIAEHLADASLCGVESRGVVRILQYERQFRSGYMSACGEARVTKRDGQFLTIDGGGGHGIPAMQLAFDTAIDAAVDTCMSVTKQKALENIKTIEALNRQINEGTHAGAPTIYQVLTNQMTGWIGSISGICNWDIVEGKPIIPEGTKGKS